MAFSAAILSSIMEISTSSFNCFLRSICAYSSFVNTVTGLKLLSLMRLQNPGPASVCRSRRALIVLHPIWPRQPNRENMMTPGRTFARPRSVAATSPPVRPPDIELALVRSKGVCEDGVHACRTALRTPQNVVPKAKVCTAEAVAKRNGAVPLIMPAAPPTTKPAPPVTWCQRPIEY